MGPFSLHTYSTNFPGTDLEQFALDHGVPREAINSQLINPIMKLHQHFHLVENLLKSTK